MKVLCFSSFTYAYLDRARVLFASLRRFHPDWELVALITDLPPPGFQLRLQDEPFDRVVHPDTLIPDFKSWLFKHDVVEVCTAVKGPFIRQACETAEVVIYLDPDTALFESLASRGKTLLVSSHILPEVEAMTRQILLIHQGKVFAQGEIPAIRELIDTHPHRVSLRVDRPREMAKLLLESSSLEGLQFQPQQEELLNLTVTNREKFYAFLLEVVVRHGFNVEEMVSTDDNLQSVFDYLVERKR